MAQLTGGAPVLAGPTRRVSTQDRQAGRSTTATVLANTVGLLFTVVMAFPAYWLVNTAFKPSFEILTFDPHFVPVHPTLDNFVSALHAPYFLTDLRNALVITGGATLAGLVVGFLGALAVARFRFYGRRGLIIVIMLVQMVPFIALLIPLFLQLNKLNLTNTLLGVTLVYMVLILPYTVWTLRGFIANIPRELDEAALVDGASRGQMFLRIILPLTGPGLVATAIYGFIQAWNEYIIIQTLNRPDHQNLMAWLFANQTAHGTYWGNIMAGALLTSLPVVIFFLVIQRHIATGITAGAIKG
jgi:N,N'-diacetylchitobiose transport system permease protein